MNGPVVQLRDIVVERGRRAVLDVPTLDVCRSEVLAVVGPNGAGKSTLLRVLALLERPARGEVIFAGSPVTGSLLAYRRKMALVFQEPLLLDTTVEANVRTGLALRAVRRDEQRRRSEEWLDRFGIAHLRGRSPRALSGGEAQRASLARAFALQPEVLLLDEPFAALDQPTRESLIEDLDTVLTANRLATVFVTHDRAEALRLGDRIAVLMQGRIRHVGSPAEVFASPVDEEVAAFVGIETIIPGRVRDAASDLATVDVGDAVIETASDLAPGSDVFVCLRPEDIVIGGGGDASAPMSARNHLRATVRRMRQSGPYIRVELDAGFPLVALITKQSLEDLALSPGSSVVATFKATAVHLIPHRRS